MGGRGIGVRRPGAGAGGRGGAERWVAAWRHHRDRAAHAGKPAGHARRRHGPDWRDARPAERARCRGDRAVHAEPCDWRPACLDYRRLGLYPRHRQCLAGGRVRTGRRDLSRWRLYRPLGRRDLRSRRSGADRGAARPAGHPVRPQQRGRRDPAGQPQAGGQRGGRSQDGLWHLRRLVQPPPGRYRRPRRQPVPGLGHLYAPPTQRLYR